MTTLRDLISQKLDLEHLDDLPAEVIADTIEGIEGSVAAKIDAIAELLNSWGQTEQVINLEIKRLQGRKKAFANRQSRLKDYLRYQLGRLNKPRLESDLHTVSLKKAPERVVVDDQTLLPVEMLRIPEPEPDKVALKKALQSGEVPGAHLERGDPVLVIQ